MSLVCHKLEALQYVWETCERCGNSCATIMTVQGAASMVSLSGSHVLSADRAVCSVPDLIGMPALFVVDINKAIPPLHACKAQTGQVCQAVTYTPLPLVCVS